MSPAGVRDPADVAIKQKCFPLGVGRTGSSLASLRSALAMARSARWWARPAAARLRCCASSPGSIASSKAAWRCPPTARSHGVQEPRLLPWRTVEQNVRLAAPHANGAVLDTLFQTLGLAAHRDHYPASSRLGSPGAWRWRAPSRSGRISCCSTSRSSRSTTRWRRGCATSSRVGLAQPRYDLAGDARHRRGHGLADRLFLLSASPARVVAEVRWRARARRARRRSSQPCAPRSRDGRRLVEFFTRPNIAGGLSTRTSRHRSVGSREELDPTYSSPRRRAAGGACRAADRSRARPTERTARVEPTTTAVATGSNMPLERVADHLDRMGERIGQRDEISTSEPPSRSFQSG